MKNSILNMTLTLVIIAVVVSVSMSYVNGLTAPLIEENAVKKLNESLTTVMEAEEFPVLEETETYVVYNALKNGEKVGFCVQNTVAGYGGDLTLLTGVDKDYKVTGVVILSHSETAGLGANANKDEFKNQYIGKSENIGVAKNSPKENDIVAISGATITSKAVTAAVNDAIVLAKEAELK